MFVKIRSTRLSAPSYQSIRFSRHADIISEHKGRRLLPRAVGFHDFAVEGRAVGWSRRGPVPFRNALSQSVIARPCQAARRCSARRATRSNRCGRSCTGGGAWPVAQAGCIRNASQKRPENSLKNLPRGWDAASERVPLPSQGQAVRGTLQAMDVGRPINRRAVANMFHAWGPQQARAVPQIDAARRNTAAARSKCAKLFPIGQALRAAVVPAWPISRAFGDPPAPRASAAGQG